MEARQDVLHRPELGIADGSVLAQHAIVARVLAGLLEATHCLARRRLTAGGMISIAVIVEQLGAVVAEEVGGGGVGVDIPTLVVEKEDGIERIVEQRLQAPAALGKRRFRLHPGRHVPHEAQDPGHAPVVDLGRPGALDTEPIPAARADAIPQRDPDLAPQGGGKSRGARREILRMDDVGERPADPVPA